MRLLPAIALSCLLLTVTETRADVDQELFLGAYVSTLRNLPTRGVTGAYRIWLKAGADQGFSILYPRPFTLGCELRGGWLWGPDDTGEVSLLVDLKYELDLYDDFGFYLLISGGGNYSGASYESVPTHVNFIDRGSFGIRIYRVLLQASYEHRSNAGLDAPNRGVDLITASVGYRF
ncbi:MAG: acyloxyacyl hydrolase [PVC group bacterium]